MRALFVAEKPSIAKSIAEILSLGQCTARPSSHRYIRNWDFVYKFPPNRQSEVTVTSVLGHLTELDFADESVRSWRQCDPIELFSSPIKKIIKDDNKGVAENLRKEIRRCAQLMIWTDCDREGEHIGAEIINVCREVNPNLEIKRARFSSIIASQVREACNCAGELDWKQVNAVDARTELDLRIGAAFTRYQTLRLTEKFPDKIQKGDIVSYGPCQFPTLGFVVDQYLKVKRFVPESFWKIEVSHNVENQTVNFSWERNHLFDFRFCVVLYEMCIDRPTARVVSVKKVPSTNYKPLPLTTVELQKAGTRLFGLNSKDVMTAAEKLYQAGFISYPRTETDQFDSKFNFKEYIEKQTSDSSWGSYAQALLDSDRFKVPRRGSKNDMAHPPIHPTSYSSTLIGIDKKIYEYVVRRFLACCSDDAKGSSTDVEIDIAGERFSASGLVVLERNYLDVYTYSNWTGHHIPNFTQGQTFVPTSCTMREGQTSRPSYLTEADLIALMDKNGIGTDATISDHIHQIKKREYVTTEGPNSRYLVPSALGIGLVEGYDKIGLDMSLSKPFLRRETESKLVKICQGHTTKNQVVSEQVEAYQRVFELTRHRLGVILASVQTHFATDNRPIRNNNHNGNSSARGRTGARGRGSGGASSGRSNGYRRRTRGTSTRGRGRGRGRGEITAY